jgi:hypothetical protein
MHKLVHAYPHMRVFFVSDSTEQELFKITS